MEGYVALIVDSLFVVRYLAASDWLIGRPRAPATPIDDNDRTYPAVALGRWSLSLHA